MTKERLRKEEVALSSIMDWRAKILESKMDTFWTLEGLGKNRDRTKPLQETDYQELVQSGGSAVRFSARNPEFALARGE